jgi:rhamnosyltransferase
MLLTLDQDSRVTEHMTEKLKNAYERLITIGEKPVLVSALQVQKESFEYWSKKNASNNNESFMFPLVVPTSGNLLNLHAHRELGGFREDYFIDDVDHEFCLRARQKGYILAQVPWAPLVHNCGNAYKRGSGAKNQKVVYEHPPLRHYFMMRNRLFTCTRYIYFHFPLVMFFYLKIIFFQIIGALVFERQRAKKLRCILLGILDWSRKISGPKIL